MNVELDGGEAGAARHRILLIANRTCPCPDLHEELHRHAGRAPAAEVELLAVAPALNSRLRHWVSDSDEAVARAEERLARAVEGLREAGLEARGEVGDADPLVAIDDTLARFPADEIVVSTHPPAHSNWLERGLIDKARERYPQPITHFVSEYGLEPVGPESVRAA